MANENGNTPDSVQAKIAESQELRTMISNLSKMLNTGLTAEQLEICMQLCEAGVNPTALSEIVKQIRTEVAELKEK